MSASDYSGTSGPLPDFLIVGAGKAGTTSVGAWLRAHPEVFLPADKEVHFFEQSWERGVDWYRAQFANAPADARVGEATPEYMIHPVYIERMAAVVPDAKLIAVLRNPVDRAWSQYGHMVARGERAWAPYHAFDGRHGPRTFEQLIDIEQATDPADWRTCGMCLARGRYIDQLRNLSARFSREQMHVALFDDLVGDPVGFFGEVCGFLGIDRTAPSIVGQSFDPLELMGPGTSEDDHRDLLSEATAQRSSQPPPEREPLAAPLRAKLVDYFRAYNGELADWLDVDLSAWNR